MKPLKSAMSAVSIESFADVFVEVVISVAASIVVVVLWWFRCALLSAPRSPFPLSGGWERRSGETAARHRLDRRYITVQRSRMPARAVRPHGPVLTLLEHHDLQGEVRRWHL